MYNPEENNRDFSNNLAPELYNELFDEMNELIQKYFIKGATVSLVLKTMKNISDDIEIYLLKEKDL